MRIVAWSVDARNDLEEIFNFYLPKNPAVAAKIHDAILEEAEKLAKWPELGFREEFINRQGYGYLFRSLVTSDGLHRIVYTFNDEYIAVARIWSCRKNPENLRI